MAKKSYVYPAKTLSQARSKFKMPHQLKTSFYHGDLNVYDCFEVLPGDTFSMDVASLIRMSTPIAPIMDNITMHLAAYFVPSRLVYDNFEQLMGANKSGSWTQDDNAYVIPVAYFGSASDRERVLGDQFGLGSAVGDFNALPGRCYALIWNEFYRSQVVSAPLAIDHSAADKILVSDTDQLTFYEHAPMLLGKYPDQFTKCLPEPQKHDPVSIIPDSILLKGASSLYKTGQIYFGHDGQTGFDSIKTLYLNSVGKLVASTDPQGQASSGTLIDQTNLVGDVEAAWNNINALRFAFQLQKFYEKDARYGTRYFEMLNGHFGVTNPDLVLQRPQLLGEMNWRINVDQVLSTAGYAASSSTTVGAPGANSVTAGKGSLFTGSFTEHGYILIVGGTRHTHTYSSSIEPLWFRSDRLDFYDPAFANIGEQPVYLKNLNSDSIGSGASGNLGESVFGYQEAWYEYRMIADKVTGLLNPSKLASLDFWTLADKNIVASTKPDAVRNDYELLNEAFIYENRDSIKRCLVTGETGPDYIADFYFDLTAVRELPMFSIPGLADHH